MARPKACPVLIGPKPVPDFAEAHAIHEARSDGVAGGVITLQEAHPQSQCEATTSRAPSLTLFTQKDCSIGNNSGISTYLGPLFTLPLFLVEPSAYVSLRLLWPYDRWPMDVTPPQSKHAPMPISSSSSGTVFLTAIS